MPPLFALLPTSDEIDVWARRLEAEAHLPRLVQKLIVLTASPTGLRIPAGKSINVPGWDGVVDVAAGTAWVPQGRSHWEWGTGDPGDKAQRDYRKRTDATAAAVRAESTFVFVSPRRWDAKDDWLERKRRDGEWRAVEAWDANDLEAWLNTAVMAHVWLAELIHDRLSELRTLLSVWDEWSDGFQPKAAPELLLAGRQREAEVVRGWIETGGYHAFQADTRNEGVAFVGATLFSSESESAAIHRAAVVSDPASWRQLLVIDRQPMILIPTYPGAWVTPALERGHVVIEARPSDEAGNSEFVLRPGPIDEVTVALESMGLRTEDAHRLARESGGRMLSLRRSLSSGGGAAAWSSGTAARFLAPALFAGSWDQGVAGDQAVLGRLARVPYRDVERELVALAAGSDPPVRQRGSIWSLIGARDVWRQLLHLVTNSDWSEFIEVATEVLGAPDPAWELPPEERWLANIKDKNRPHSAELRGGLAESLAMVGSLSDFATLPGGRSGPQVAAVVVRRLLEAADADPSGAGWAALHDQLSLLAEAAPDGFLDGVRQGLAGDDPVLKRVFVEEKGLLTPRTYLPGLLWALERLAWSPDYLTAVAVILVRLAALDPGGTSSNRPANTFFTIFVPWHPQTTGDRLAALEAARRADAHTAWPLLFALLPSPHGTIATNSSRPEWRGWLPNAETKVSHAEYWEMIHSVLRWLIADAGQDGQRWAGLVEALPDLPSEFADEVLAGLAALDTGVLVSEALEHLSTELQNVIGHHRAYPDADWAMDEERIAKVEAVAGRFEPGDAIVRHRWLFTTHPTMERVAGRDYRRYDENLGNLRRRAVEEVFAQRGWPGIEELVAIAEQAYTVGWAAAWLDDAVVDDRASEWAQSDDERLREALNGLFFARNRQKGWDWTEAQVRGHQGTWPPDLSARALLAAPDRPEVWQLAIDLGREVETSYWKAYRGFPRGTDAWSAVRKLLEHGRPFAAIQLIGTKLTVKDGTLDPDLAYAALDAAARATSAPDPGEVAGIEHEVNEILTALDSTGFDEDKLARIEWVFLQLLDHGPRRPRLLQKRLACDAAFFAEVVGLVFRARSEARAEDDAPPDPQLVRYAQHAYRLLQGWTGPVPGADGDGSLDEELLRDWVVSARRALRESDRAEIGDQRIGHILWHSPKGTDGNRPHEAVRNLIEDVGSSDIETGFGVEAFNSRGAVFRGRGGDQERELASGYRETADAFATRWPRTAGLFRGLAAQYEAMAKREDIEADSES